VDNQKFKPPIIWEGQAIHSLHLVGDWMEFDQTKGQMVKFPTVWEGFRSELSQKLPGGGESVVGQTTIDCASSL